MTPRPGSGDVTLPELAGALIASFEGCKLTAYQDPGGVWTIGRGHTGPVNGAKLGPGMTITQQQAEELFVADQAHLFAMVQDRPLLEAAALVSFGYNCGAGALQRVLIGMADMRDFNHAGGQVLDSVTRRRELEWTLVALSQQEQG